MPHPSSATFWDLMDRWDVSDDQATELVGYEAAHDRSATAFQALERAGPYRGDPVGSR
jgi:hypothetical protein